MTKEKQRRRMEIYIADIRVFSEESLFHEKMRLMPEERRAHIERYRNAADKQRSLGAGLLLEYGLRKQGLSLLEAVPGTVPVKVERGTYGKPYIPDADQVWFNLSHAGDYVAAVFADCETGIDIERIRKANLTLAKRYFTEQEYTYLEEEKAMPDEACRRKVSAGETGQCVSETDRRFTWMWTRKESYIKAVGEGMHLPLVDFSVLEDRISGKMDYYLRTWEMPEGYMLSVCAELPVEAEVTTVSFADCI